MDSARERLLEALALTLAENCELRDQRNRALSDVDDTESERDRLAGLADELAAERALSDERLAKVVRLTQHAERLRRTRVQKWVAFVGVVCGLTVGAAAGYGVARLAF